MPTAILRDQTPCAGLGTSAKLRDYQTKDSKGRVKGSKRKYADDAFFIDQKPQKIDESDIVLDDNSNGKDEFDDLINSKGSYTDRLGIDSSLGKYCFVVRIC